MGEIYKITNKIDNKSYIGHTTIYRYSKDWVLLNNFDTLAETLQFLGLKEHSDLYKSIKKQNYL